MQLILLNYLHCGGTELDVLVFSGYHNYIL